MRSYLSLAGISAKAHRKSSRVTQLCIMIAVVLVISVFSMVDFEYMHMTEKLVRDHGNWHIALNHVPKEEAESVWNEADVKAACWYDTFNYRLTSPSASTAARSASSAQRKASLRIFGRIC